MIDSKAELERRSLLADAEAGRIRKVALADAERMKSEASLLKENPLLINKIVAERMSSLHLSLQRPRPRPGLL